MAHYEDVCLKCFKVLRNMAYDKHDEITSNCKERMCPYGEEAENLRQLEEGHYYEMDCAHEEE